MASDNPLDNVREISEKLIEFYGNDQGAERDFAKTIGAEREVVRQTVRPVHPAAVEPAPPKEQIADNSSEANQPSASVHDLVQELRARRAPEEIKPASAKGRASLPSWDEIVLGTGKSDVETDQRDS